MAAIQEINRNSKKRTEIRAGDVVEVSARVTDHLHIVNRVRTNYYDLTCLVSGFPRTVHRNYVHLFDGSFKMYNVL